MGRWTALVAAGHVGVACAEPPTAVTVDTGSDVAEVSPRFLSFSIDASNVDRPYDFTRPRLRRMAGELAPAMLRIGGTDSDKIYYDLSDAPVAEPPPPYQAVLTRTWWDAACAFASDLDLEILFTLNVGPGPRDPDTGRWIPDNARELLQYTRAQGCPVTVWELGNEINGFTVAHGFRLDGAEYAADMAIARALVDEVDPETRLAGPADIYWPVWGELVSTMPEFLAAGGDLVDIVTWHYYPQQSQKCELVSRLAMVDTLLYPEGLDEVTLWAAEVEALRDQHAPEAEVWLDETGHALCGGEDGLSDRFVTGFWWLDQLGLMARRGQQIVVRQALTGGEYRLIDNATLEPSPDYFNSLLWKRLMGVRALAVGGSDDRLRLYAHCTAGRPGAVTVLAINLDQTASTRFDIAGLGGDRELYLVTGPDLVGTEIRVNEVALAVAADGSPPEIAPAEAADPITLPPLSYAFVVAPDADAPACR